MIRSRLLVIYEQASVWSRQLRARLTGRPIRWRETRTAEEVESALAGSSAAIVVVDLASRPTAGLEAIARASRSLGDPLILALEPLDRKPVAALAEELGATLVLRGPVAPPEVAALLAQRWLNLSQRRADAQGHAQGDRQWPEPWNRFAPAT